MTVTVTPTVEASTGPDDAHRVRLNVAGTTGVTSATITRLDPDGRLRPVRTSDGGPLAISGGVGLLYDYEAPFGSPVSYSSLESPTVASASVTVDESQIWLIHPGVPALSTPIELAADSFQEEEWAVSEGVHWPMGREFAVVQTDGQRKAAASSMTVAVSSPVELRRLRALLGDAGTLLLNVPASMSLGIDTCYISVGAVRNRRPSDIGSDPTRALVLPYRVVDMPVGGSQADRTYVDVLVDNASYTSLTTRYGTYFDLLTGP